MGAPLPGSSSSASLSAAAPTFLAWVGMGTALLFASIFCDLPWFPTEQQRPGLRFRRDFSGANGGEWVCGQCPHQSPDTLLAQLLLLWGGFDSTYPRTVFRTAAHGVPATLSLGPEKLGDFFSFSSFQSKISSIPFWSNPMLLPRSLSGMWPWSDRLPLVKLRTVPRRPGGEFSNFCGPQSSGGSAPWVPAAVGLGWGLGAAL